MYRCERNYRVAFVNSIIEDIQVGVLVKPLKWQIHF